jgi:predicted nucleotidyltransferase
MTREEALAILRAHRDELRARHVKTLALFGSVARNEAGPDSDVDLLVEFDGSPVGLFAFSALQRYLADILGRRVDLATRKGLKPRLRERILAEAIPAD